MADALQCDYRLPGRSGGYGEFVATGLGDGRGRYRLTPAGRLFRIEPRDPKASAPCPLTGVVRLWPKGRVTNTAFLLTFISGVIQAVQAVPVHTRQKKAKALRVLGKKERMFQRAIGRTTRQLFTQLKRVDPEIALLATLVFDDPDKAAAWLAQPRWILGSRSPLHLIARGRRRVVLDELNAILNGFPT